MVSAYRRTLHQCSPRMVCTSGSFANMTNAFTVVAQSKASDGSASRARTDPVIAATVVLSTAKTTCNSYTGTNAQMRWLFHSSFSMHFAHTLQDSCSWPSLSKASGLVTGSVERPHDSWSPRIPHQLVGRQPASVGDWQGATMQHSSDRVRAKLQKAAGLDPAGWRRPRS
jgi:hypothetical protein